MTAFSFSPLKAEPQRREILAFDIEGRGGPEGFVCGAIVGAFTAGFYTDRAAMWQALKEYGASGAWIFAHNLEYDLPIVAGEELWDGELVFKEQGILWAIYQHWGKKVRLYDSLNLFPRWSVQMLAELAGSEKLEVRPDLMASLSLGVPWRFLHPDDQRKVERYCTRDAEIVYKAVSELQEITLALGGQLRPTISGVSMDIYRRSYQRLPWKVTGPAINRLCRPAFYGGRVENFAMGEVPQVNLYDINSLYPYVQGTAQFPHPAYLQLLAEGDLQSPLQKWEGVAKATVSVPETFVPPLPYRLTHKLFFPTGELRGHWTLAELRAALDRGCELQELDWILGSPVLFNPFSDFVEDLYRQRMGYLVAGDNREDLVKLVLNSLYGRFGLDPDGGLFHMIRIQGDTDLEGLRGYSTTDFAGALVAYGPIPDLQPPAYANVLFAAQVSSGARIKLLEALEGQELAAVYCDTDSIMTTGELATGDKLGSWKLQMQAGTADLLGPKEYVLHNHTLGTQYVVKGVPERLARQYITEGAARFKRAIKIREAMKRRQHPAEWVEVFQTHRYTLPKRIPALTPWEQPASWVTTLPWAQPQLLKAVQESRTPPKGWVRARPPQYQPEWVRQLAEDLSVPIEQLQRA